MAITNGRACYVIYAALYCIIEEGAMNLFSKSPVMKEGKNNYFCLKNGGHEHLLISSSGKKTGFAWQF